VHTSRCMGKAKIMVVNIINGDIAG